MGVRNRWLFWSKSTKGNQYINHPIRKISRVLLKILASTCDWDKVFHFDITKLMAVPMAKRKDGYTRSVGVNPFHFAWCKGEYANSPLPGVFTMIIKQMVIPRKVSRAKDLCWEVDMWMDFGWINQSDIHTNIVNFLDFSMVQAANHLILQDFLKIRNRIDSIRLIRIIVVIGK